MTTSQAVWFSAPHTVQIRDEMLPPLGAGELLVETVASALSHGSEMLVYRGQVPAGTILDLPTLSGSFDFPIKYGYASVGRVRRTGSAVADVRPGDLVFALHPHQTTFTISASLAWRLPPELSPERGLFAANVETALNALLDEPVRVGEHVVVFGQGVVGMLIGLLARRNGAARVIVVDPYERRRRLALMLGADEALSPDDLAARLVAATGDRRADLVFEASGNPTALPSAIEAVAPNGTVVVCSWYGAKPVALELGGRFHRGRIQIRSSQVGQIDPSLSSRWDRARRTSTVLDLLASLPLPDLISHRILFQRAAEAYRLVDQCAEDTMQVVLTYQSRQSG